MIHIFAKKILNYIFDKFSDVKNDHQWSWAIFAARNQKYCRKMEIGSVIFGNARTSKATFGLFQLFNRFWIEENFKSKSTNWTWPKFFLAVRGEKMEKRLFYNLAFEIFVKNWNFDSWQNFRSLTKISIFGKKFRFFGKILFLTKISIFRKKISIFHQNFDFSRKFRFFTKISIFHENFDFSRKFQYFTKISIIDKNFDFSRKFRFFTKISIFHENFDFWQKFRFSPFGLGLIMIFDKKNDFD